MDIEAPAQRARKAKNRRGSGAASSAPVSQDERSRRVNDAVRPTLTLVLQLQLIRRDRRPPAELAYQHVKGMLAQTLRKLEALRLSPEDFEHVKYALVAFIDEMMQLEPGPTKDFWQSHLLQLEHFGETRAGEGFFQRLERLQSDDNHLALHVYYLCLLLGFHGIYGQHGELERENLVDALRSRLGLRAEREQKPLSPEGERPDEPGVDRERNRLLQWLAVAAALMASLWYFGLLFTLDAQESSLSETLREAYEDAKAGLGGSAE
jgi:type VI secretion system protein ImpK